MIITVLDVLGRYFLNAPLIGAFELTKVFMGMMTFAALPLVSAYERHITVGLFDPLLDRTRRRQAARLCLVNLIGAIFMGFMAWRIWLLALDLSGSGLTTPSLLIPMAPFAFYMAAMAVLTMFALIAVAISHLTSGRISLFARSRAAEEPADPGEP
jgi:TRAP-type C4-dicarboxylate transport system permease small subunit